MPPLISGEWGYAACTAPCGYYPYTGQIDTLTQAKYLSRQWLVNTLEVKFALNILLLLVYKSNPTV